MAIRAPKQWALTKNETITSFEAWRQNLQYTLSLDPNFALFLVEGASWLKKSSTTPLRGFADDGETIPEASRRTAAQKSTHLDLMLGQIANYCPIISRNTIVKNSTSVNQIWQAIRLHFGFQSSGSHFLDFNSIQLDPGERPEDLYQRLNSFVEDNLLKSNGSIRHHGDIPEYDEDMSPTLENFVVLTWLRLVHPDLPALVKQRYGTELRSQTLSSIKPEISQALDSLLEEIHASSESKVLRAAIKNSSANVHKSESKQLIKTRVSCPLCKQAGRPYQHFLSKCNYLPESDKAYLSKTRLTREISDIQDYDSDSDDYALSRNRVSVNEHQTHSLRVVSTMRRISTKQSPQMKVFYKHYPLQLILDSGAEISMIKTSVANYISAPINKTNQKALQADGVTPLSIAGETHIVLSRNNVDLKLEALVVNDLDIDILAGIPFMTTNDISLRPSKQQIIIGDSQIVRYGPSTQETPFNRVRR
ncbi:MAG: retropepsin-like domain-containing protein, partial [Candidatus Thiodiazotropha endolucinida]|nr:retropepsin-like domain-containing protein [Candidatus Thiodiazotropha taylori]MCW4345573.1 retropepsin-like domain-containing protein [Candidatus Thiodiazotropha endolucinida]